MRRRDVLKGMAAAPFAAGTLAAPALGQNLDARTLRVIQGYSLSSIDPVWTTASASNDLAYLVYDQLFGMDADFNMQLQMAESWSSEDDARTHIITLRDGLKFHDGEPVRANDCVASINRWASKDSTGQALGRLIDKMDVMDDKTFRIRLTQPFAWLAHAIGKPNSSQCAIMPERFASMPSSEQVPEAIGSGPFRFLPEEFISGSQAIFTRFEDYVPRSEPVSGNAGGKVAQLDRIEWSFITDPSTAMAALQTGQQDYWTQPLPDLVPLLQADPNLVVRSRIAGGIAYSLVMNHLHAPFDNPAVRQAVAMAVDQEQFMQAAAGGNPGSSGFCQSFYMCDTAYATEDAGAVLRERNIEKARQALADSGYQGETVVVLGVTDPPALASISLVTNDLLRQIGFNVDYVTTDFAGMTQRRVSKDAPTAGGWSVFNSTYGGTGLLNPLYNIMLRGAGERSWFGWPDNAELERLRDQWMVSTDPAEQAALAEAIQVEGFKTLPYIPLGYSLQPQAWRKNLTGVYDGPNYPLWSIGKEA